MVPPVVVVRWWDIIGMDQAWFTEDDLDSLEPATITTVGLLHEQNDQYIIVVSSWDDSEEDFGNVNCIPLGVIQEMVEVELPEVGEGRGMIEEVGGSFGIKIRQGIR